MPLLVNKVLLDHSHVISFICCLTLILCYQGRTEWLWQIIHLQSQKNLSSDPSWKKKVFWSQHWPIHIYWSESVSLVVQSCLTLCDPLACSPPGFSVCGIFQARIQEWGAIPFSKGSSWTRDQVSCIGRLVLITSTTWKTPRYIKQDYIQQ